VHPQQRGRLKHGEKEYEMIKHSIGALRRRGTVLGALMLVAVLAAPAARAGDAKAEIDRDVDNALETLYAKSPVATALSKDAKGILVFPKIVKAGLIVGGQYGKGALRQGGLTTGYYNTVAASYGLQIGAQTFGYALFFMKDSALEYLNKSKGWEVGVGPSIVVVDSGVAKSLTTSTTKDDIYAFFFSQQGLMAGLGLQGSKITEIHPGE
jgi:lipid-binding SYLF domain-containing protein